MTLQGTLAALTAYLSTPAQVSYTAPSTTAVSSYALTIELNDNGNTGGSALSATRTINVTVGDLVFDDGFE